MYFIYKKYKITKNYKSPYFSKHHQQRALPPPPPLVVDDRQSQTQDSNDEEVEEINREPYDRMNHSGEINSSIPLPVQQTLYQISQDEVCYHQLIIVYFLSNNFFV